MKGPLYITRYENETPHYRVIVINIVFGFAMKIKALPINDNVNIIFFKCYSNLGVVTKEGVVSKI